MRFGYTPFGKARHDRAREHALLRLATQLAQAYGYQRRSVWTFNRVDSPTYSSITRPYYLGLGAGAASFAGKLFLVNHFGIDPYHEAVAGGHLPVARLERWVTYHLIEPLWAELMAEHDDAPDGRR